SIEALETKIPRKEQIQALSLAVSPLMNLGDVRTKTVRKLAMVSAPVDVARMNTRGFIPNRVHDAVRVLTVVSVATAATIPGAVGHDVAVIPQEDLKFCKVEHPTGELSVAVELDDDPSVLIPKTAAIMRTARLLMEGKVYY